VGATEEVFEGDKTEEEGGVVFIGGIIHPKRSGEGLQCRGCIGGVVFVGTAAGFRLNAWNVNYSGIEGREHHRIA
jgi:hypothetical protein